MLRGYVITSWWQRCWRSKKKKDAEGKVSAASQISVADIAPMAFSTATHKHILGYKHVL